jgi:paraquat-inducible protein B
MSEIAKPILTRDKWNILLIWAMPVIVGVFAMIMVFQFFANRGPEITIEFADASGLVEGETRLLYRGAEVGRVSGISLTEDKKHSVVTARLQKREDIFATKGASFWIARPEVSSTSLKGLDTLVSGSYIHANPGKGEEENLTFSGLDREPARYEAGDEFVLAATRMGHAQEGAVVSYKGMPVGVVRGVELAKDATHVNIKITVFSRYAHLVRENSKFWIDSGFDFKGGIFSGISVQLESLKTVISGGIAFATPEKDTGHRAKEGRVFALEAEAKKEWQAWSPVIPISPKAGDGDAKKADVSIIKREAK